MGEYSFYAMLSRMKYINRWGLMNNTKNENISEHSLQVAILTHCLVLIHNKYFGGNLNPERGVLLAIFHDATEIITGDMPTPIKYYNPEIKSAYKKIEDMAGDRLISLLPDDFKADYERIIKMNSDEDRAIKPFLKLADRYSALLKCIDEIRMGNEEFKSAKLTIEKSIEQMHMPEAEVFEKKFLPSFYLTLDEQGE